MFHCTPILYAPTVSTAECVHFAICRGLRDKYAGMHDERVPELAIQNYGYMYLADNEPFANVLWKPVGAAAAVPKRNC